MAAEVACLGAAGLRVAPPVWDDLLQRYHHSIGLGRPGEDTSEAERAYEVCHQCHLRMVAMEWARTADTSVFDEALLEARRTCVGEADVGSSHDELLERSAAGKASRAEDEVLFACMEQSLEAVLGDEPVVGP